MHGVTGGTGCLPHPLHDPVAVCRTDLGGEQDKVYWGWYVGEGRCGEILALEPGVHLRTIGGMVVSESSSSRLVIFMPVRSCQ